MFEPPHRRLLPWLVALLWLLGTWKFVLRWPGLTETLRWGLPEMPRFSELAIAGWFLAMMATMVAADRLLCWLWRRRIDPMKVHWSRLRNVDGRFFCAACRSVFLMPPADRRDEDFVCCGDCGHRVAPYGEMKPYFDEIWERWAESVVRRF